MKLLKKENWWIWLMLMLFSRGSSNIALAALLDCFNKKAWYANYKNWLIGFLCFILPGVIMIMVFYIQLLSLVAAKLDVPGKELYLSPYVWILCLIVPVIGWTMFSVMIIYLEIWILVSLYRGNGEKYIEC